MSDRKLRVYLSSTTTDFGEIREQLAAVLSRLGYEPVFMGQYTAAAVAPLEKVLKDVATCDIYVGLFAFWYGEPIAGLGKSHTEMEYREARQRRIPCLLFLLHESADWKACWFDRGERSVLMESLRAELLQQDSHMVSLFKETTELLTTVPQALHELERHALPASEAGAAPPAEPRGEAVVGLRFQDVRCFKDRSEELEQIRRALIDANGKVLCVCGRSGAGKTALVSRFGEMIETAGMRFPETGETVDGIVYFPCRRAGGTIAERLWFEICQWLPPTKRDELRKIWTDATYSDEEKYRQLLARFQQGCFLAFLDAFESVVGLDGISDPGLRTFLEVCLRTPHSLRIIITADAVFDLPSDARHFCRQLNLDRGLPPADAIELLRSLDSDGELELASAPNELLARVVQRCEGLPRTLIAVVGILSNDETLSVERMLDDPAIWTKIIEEQYERHSPDRRRVLEVLSVFDRPVPRDAVEFVIAGLATDSPDDPFAPGAEGRFAARLKQSLSDLVHGQIVTAMRRQGTYEIQPKMQEYAYARIPAAGPRYNRGRCHGLAADYFATRRKPQDEWRSLEDIQPQLDEFEHRIRAEQFDAAAEVLDAIDEEFLQIWGRYQLLIRMYERLVDRLQNPDRAQRALGSLALSYRRVGRLSDAIACFQRALDHAREDATALSNWHTELGNTYADAVNMAGAVEEYQQAIEIANRNGNLAGEARALGNLAIAFRQLGQVERAITHYQDALERDRRRLQAARSGDEVRAAQRWYVTHTGNLGKALLTLGRLTEAEQCFTEAIAISHEYSFDYAAATFRHHKAEAAVLAREFAKAIELCELSMAHLVDSGEARVLSYVLLTCGLARSRQAEFDAALELCRQGLELHVPETRQALLLLQGIVRLGQADQARARADFEAAIAACNDVIAATPHFYEALYSRGIAELATGRHEAALLTIRSAAAVCSAAGVRHATLGELELLSSVAPQTAGLAEVRDLLEDDLPPLR